MTSSMTLRNSGWRWPTTGSAVAFRTRSATLAGPGPIMVFCGMLIGDSRDFGGAIVTDDILAMGFVTAGEDRQAGE